jgi:hypothetical protein
MPPFAAAVCNKINLAAAYSTSNERPLNYSFKQKEVIYTFEEYIAVDQ